MQDPSYSKADKAFNVETGLAGHVRHVDDPDAFSQVTDKTVLVNFTERGGIWYKLEELPQSMWPAVIVTPLFDVDDDSNSAPKTMIEQYQDAGVVASSPDISSNSRPDPEGQSKNLPVKFWIKKQNKAIARNLGGFRHREVLASGTPVRGETNKNG